MFDRRWTVRDRFGCKWRLWTSYGTESSGLSTDEAQSAMRGLMYFSLDNGPSRYDAVALALFEIHNELSRDSLSHDEWVQSDLGSARRISDRVSDSLKHAVRSGHLRIEQESEVEVRFVPEKASETPAPPPQPQRERVPVDWVGIALVDASGRALGDRPYRIQLNGGLVRQGWLEPNGTATLTGIAPGTCIIDCPFHAATEATVHVVAAGEHAPGIAAAYGFENFNDIWNASENTDLRARRRVATVLAPGDELYVPARSPQSVSRPTGAQHRFVSKEAPLKLRVRLRDFLGRPIGDTAVGLVSRDESETLTTDGDGHLEAGIAASARHERLLFDDVELPFAIGYLDPIDEESGRTARLTNLGYLLDPADADDEDDVRLAIEDFQADHDLPTTGVFDEATQAHLLAAHGC